VVNLHRTSGLHWFAVLTALATLGLLCIGGLVTSHGVGMAVPDWPNTYGYNMFFFPLSQWVGGIFYEHSHRLVASGVGLMTTILALWLYGKSARPLMRWAGLAVLGLGLATWMHASRRWADGLVLGMTGLALVSASLVWPRCEASPRWLRRLGVIAFFAVVLQGVLGGLRVVLLKDAIGILHATLAQSFFVLICAIALFTSAWWQHRTTSLRFRSPARNAGWGILLRWGLVGTTGLILGQLVLGAAMRHQHAGLAIPDFPLAYDKLWPAMDPGSVARYNQQRLEVLSVNPITAFQIALQMTHRIVAVLIICAVAICAGSARHRLGGENLLRRMTVVWLGLILTQVLLGAATIWSGKAADFATAHVLVGALSLALGVIMCIISSQELVFARRVTDSPTASEPLPGPTFGPRTLVGANPR
jgi:heme a synthase